MISTPCSDIAFGQLVVDQLSVLLLLWAAKWFWRSYCYCPDLETDDDYTKDDAVIGIFICIGGAVIIEAACVLNWMAT